MAKGSKVQGVKKGEHRCPICKGYGHHWHNCNEGNPEDYQAMLAERGPPKKRKSSSNPASVTSIVPAPTTSAPTTYPPSQSIQTVCKKGGNQSTTNPYRSDR